LLDALFEATDARDLVDRLRSRREASGPEELQQLILSGGYPTPALMPSEARSTWFASFRQTYIERDLRDLTQIANLPEFSRLMTTLTLRTAQLLNASELSRQVGLPTTTLRRYVHLLEQTFQFDFLQPFAANLAKRLVKMPKVYASDTGMACHLAAAADWTALERRNLVGPIVETWAHAEIRKALALQTLRTEISFWRTRTAQEVDFFLERGGEIVGIEVKWSSKLDRRDLRALNRCLETLGDAWRLGVVLHGGVDAVALDGQTAALPFSLAFA